MAEDTLIVVDTSIFAKDAAAKTAKANEVAKKYGISDEALKQVEDYKDQLTYHQAWDLPFLGYVDEDGYGYAYVPDKAVAADGWDAHKAFLSMPDDVQTAFAIRMLYTHRDVDRHGAEMFLHHGRGLTVRFQSPTSASY